MLETRLNLLATFVALGVAGLFLAGCQSEESTSRSKDQSSGVAEKSPQSTASNSTAAAQQPAGKPADNLDSPPAESPGPSLAQQAEPAPNEETPAQQPRPPLPVSFPGLHEALNKTPLDEDRIKAHGIRKLTGKHLTLYTDMPTLPEIEELPAVFDLAVPQWIAYFQLDVDQVNEWHIIGRLMKEKARFQKAGLLPESLPAFGHGFNYDTHLWVYDQSTDYYRRHLLLHEGTHAFMQQFLGGSGPAWYREGMAELLGTHRWVAGKLKLNYFPQDRTETPGWGRIKIIKDEVAAGRGMMLTKVLQFPPTAHRQVRPYAWCWAATTFFENHPQYRERFQQLRTKSKDTSDVFSNQFYQQLQDQWPEVRDQWQWFVLHMEYGFDIQREAIDPKPVRPLPEDEVDLEVQADRGWQSTGLKLAPGAQVEVLATGRYQIAADPEVWWCEPNGVSIHYYRRRPLGVLLAAVNGPNNGGLTRLVNIQTIGLAGTISTVQGGVLFLRINESGASLADNKGTCKVRIKRKTQK